MRQDTVSGYNLLFMGMALGTAFGLLVGPMLGLGTPRWDADSQEREPEDQEPGVAKKVLDKIPTRVKLAAAGGAVKGAGKEAYHEIKQKATGER